MNYLGDFLPGAEILVPFNTFDSNDPSASVTITNLINTDVHIHKNDSLTQRNNAAGITVSIDFDGITGSHMIKIDTADNTVANFFTSGNDFFVRIEGTTVDGATINAIVAHFSLDNRMVAGKMVSTDIATLASQTSFTLTKGSADDDAYNRATAVISDLASGIQKCFGLILNYTGSSKTVTLAGDPGIFTMAAGDNITIFAASALANIAAIDNDKLAAENLKDTYNGTGYVNGVAPGTQDQASNLTVAGSASKTPALLSPNGFVVAFGENEANNEDATRPLDGTTHDIEAQDDTGTEKIDVYYEMNVGAGIPSEVTWHGRLDRGGGGAKNIDVQVQDVDADTWRTIGNITSSILLQTETFDIFINEVGTGDDLGTVRIRFLTGSASFTATTKLLTDQIFVSFNTGSISNLDAIYFDSNESNTNTGHGDGVPGNPVSSEAAVNTLLAARNLHKVEVAPGSTVTFATSHDNEFWEGVNWDLALGGQSIVGITVSGAGVSGVAAGTGTTQTYINCRMGATSHIKGTHIHTSGIMGTQTVVEAGDFFFDRCHSAIAGTSTWVFEFGDAVGNTNLNLRHNSGGIQLESMGDNGTDTASIEGFGQIIEGTCTGGVVATRGLFTTSGITNLTISDDARFARAQLVDDMWDEILTGSEHNINNSSGKRLRQCAESVAYEGTVNDASATTTSFIIDSGASSVDGYYVDGTFRFIDGALAGQSRIVLTYTGATRTITFDEALTSAPANGVGFQIDADHVHPVSQIQSGLATAAALATVDGIVDAILSDTNELVLDDIPGLIAALQNISSADVLAQVITGLNTAAAESYAAKGAPASPVQMMYWIMQLLTELSITNTTETIYELDGVTVAGTNTINDSVNPTKRERTT